MSSQANLLILDGQRDSSPGRNPLYRGTYRLSPTYCDALPADHETNMLFSWYITEGGESGVVHDLQRASRYVELLNHQSLNHSFEIVEATTNDAAPVFGELLMGFDLSASYGNSLLQWGVKQFLPALSLPLPIRDLLELISRSYAPQLNGQGLFQSFEVASLCLRSMSALQALSPNLFEGGDLNAFSVVGLYSVTRREKN